MRSQGENSCSRSHQEFEDRLRVDRFGAADSNDYKTTPDGPDATVVVITESKFAMTEEGVKRALGQTAGWTYTLCGLKAYVQFGINLRTGLNKRLTDV